MAAMIPVRQVRAGVLDIGYHESGPAGGLPVLLMHGFPYDIHAYAEVAPLLAAQGCRVIVPFMRGYGSTRFVTGPHRHRVVPGAGNNLPQEKPQDFANAILELVNASRP